MMEFPLPPAEALVFSDALKRRVTDRIESQNGWISFADYMTCVLYEPGLGYYAVVLPIWAKAGISSQRQR